jgi:hypothetical protein
MRGLVCMLRLSLLLGCLSPTGIGSAYGAGRGERSLATLAAQDATKAGPGRGGTEARRLPIYVGQISAPAGLPGLGNEMARTLRTVLSESGLDARLVLGGGGTGGSRGDGESTLSGRIDEAGSGRVRLSLGWRGHSAQALGDLEHLDDLAYAALEGLRPRLLADAGSASPPTPSGTGASSPGPALAALTPPPPAPPAASSAPAKVASPAPADGRKRPAPRPVVLPASSTPPSPATPSVVLAASSKEKSKGPDGSPPARPEPPAPYPPATPPPSSPPGEPHPPAAPERVLARPRIAVHLVGEPLTPLPPAFLGAGAMAQQTMLAYLQSRLHCPAVASRLTGLVGGLDALTQSLRMGARHTLMARFDTLVDGFGPFGARTISGRLHVVLLLDGRPLLDRSLSIPPSTYYPTEPPAQVIARIVTAALDAIGAELAARLGAPPPQAH